MEAVARRKAHWLFRTGSDDLFSGAKRPQEDMVTSAVFGSIKLMSPHDRRLAIDTLLGRDYFSNIAGTAEYDIKIDLWPSLKGSEGRKRVEPDVLLTCAGKTVVVEVKWHAKLSERQLQHQIEAAKLNGHDVIASVILGEAGVNETIHGKRCHRQTWRDVSSAVQTHPLAQTDQGPFRDWLRIMRDFLQQTDMGRIFNGLKKIEQDPGLVAYRFAKLGNQPWLISAPATVKDVNYKFGAKYE